VFAAPLAVGQHARTAWCTRCPSSTRTQSAKRIKQGACWVVSFLTTSAPVRFFICRFAQGLSPVAYAPSGLLPPIRRGSELRPIWSAAGSGVELDHYQCQHTYE